MESLNRNLLCSVTVSITSCTTPEMVDRQVYSPASDRARSVKVRVDVRVVVDTPVVISLPPGPNHWIVGEPLTPSTVQVREYVPPSAGVPILLLILIV